MNNNTKCDLALRIRPLKAALQISFRDIQFISAYHDKILLPYTGDLPQVIQQYIINDALETCYTVIFLFVRRIRNMEWVKILVSALAGLAAAIPLVVELVKYVQKAIREKNWSKVLDMVMNLMQTAETKFETGAERKEWVLAMVKASADTIDYDIDMDAISDLIDSLCNMSKVVNAPKA